MSWKSRITSAFVAANYVKLDGTNQAGWTPTNTVVPLLNASLLEGHAASYFQTALTFPLAATLGGTGVANNATNTLTFTGHFSLGLTLTANTALTLPTSGYLAYSAGASYCVIDNYIDQAIKVASTPQFARLGLGSVAHATSGLLSDGSIINTTITNIADHDYYGDALNAMTVTNAYGLFAALYLAANGQYYLAVASADTTCPCTAIAAETGSGSKKVIVGGLIRDDSWSLVTGPGKSGLVYLDPSTAGAITQTKPSVSGQQIQVLGYAITSHILKFAPSLLLIEVA